MGESSNWTAQDFNLVTVLRKDDVVVKVTAVGPNVMNGRYEIWHHKMELGHGTTSLLTSRSSERRARRYHARYVTKQYRQGWIPIEEAS